MNQNYIYLLCFTIVCYSPGFSQNIGIGTASPHASALLDITHTGKGLLIPRMGTVNIAAISNPAKGLLVYDTIENQLMVNMGSNLAPDWQTIGSKSGWNLTGNSGTDANSQFIGTTDNVALNFKVNNQQAGKIEIGNSGNTSLGFEAAIAVSSGNNNSAFGAQALTSNTTGNFNTATGNQALRSNTTGGLNAANGSWALYSNTTGSYNTANGHSALYSNNGSYNVASGASALVSNVSGTYNAAVGAQAMFFNGGGNHNVAIGYRALYGNTGGAFNTANGVFAMNFNTIGVNNTATGSSALYSNTSGAVNSAYGNAAVYSNTTGSNNVGVGNNALYYNASGSYNTAVGNTAGNNAGTNPSNFTALGYNAGHLGSNSNTIEIGNSSVSWIGGNVGWSTYFSDERAKTDVNENVPGISFISKLRPVTYRLSLEMQQAVLGVADNNNWDGKYDIEQQVQSGFIAQEVEQAAKELNYDFIGVAAPIGNRKLYSMQYSAFVVPLVKAVQEQQQIIEKQQQKIDELSLQVQALLKKQ